MNLLRAGCFAAGLLALVIQSQGVEPWQAELAKMPLATSRIRFFKGEPAKAILPAFQSNAVVKAIIFMPGATDELYFNDRGPGIFTNTTPTVLDAVRELISHSAIRARFQSPFLLLGETNDFSEPLLEPPNAPILETLRRKSFAPAWVMMDKEWDYLYPTLAKYLRVKITPPLGSSDAWHFYRVYFAAHGLNALEAMELVSLATQTAVQIEKDRLIFVRRAEVFR